MKRSDRVSSRAGMQWLVRKGVRAGNGVRIGGQTLDGRLFELGDGGRSEIDMVEDKTALSPVFEGLYDADSESRVVVRLGFVCEHGKGASSASRTPDRGFAVYKPPAALLSPALQPCPSLFSMPTSPTLSKGSRWRRKSLSSVPPIGGTPLPSNVLASPLFA